MRNPYCSLVHYGHVPRHPMTHAPPLDRAHIPRGTSGIGCDRPERPSGSERAGFVTFGRRREKWQMESNHSISPFTIIWSCILIGGLILFVISFLYLLSLMILYLWILLILSYIGVMTTRISDSILFDFFGGLLLFVGLGGLITFSFVIIAHSSLNGSLYFITLIIFSILGLYLMLIAGDRLTPSFKKES